MPNNTKNLIRFAHFDEDTLLELQAALRGMSRPEKEGDTSYVPKELLVDFNRLIPMSDQLYYTECSSVSDYGYMIVTNDRESLESMAYSRRLSIEALIAELETRFPNIRELGQRYLDNETEYGFKDSLAWSRMNWGTKWNAYQIGEWKDGFIELWGDVECAPDGGRAIRYWTHITFETAWSMPVPIIRKIAELAKKHGADFDHWYSDEGGADLSFDPVKNEYVTVWTHSTKSDIDY